MSLFDKVREARATEGFLTRSNQGGGNIKYPENMKMWRPTQVVKDGYSLELFPYIVTTDSHPDFIAAKDGVTAAKGTPWWRAPYAMHWLGGKAYFCPKRTRGQSCPICDKVKELRKDKVANADIIKAVDSYINRSALYLARVKGVDGMVVYDTRLSMFEDTMRKSLQTLSSEEGYENIAEFWTDTNRFRLLLGMENKPYGDGKTCVNIGTIMFFPSKTKLTDAEVMAFPSLDDCFGRIPTDDELLQAWSGENAVKVSSTPATPQAAPVQVAPAASAKEPVASAPAKVEPTPGVDPADEAWGDTTPVQPEAVAAPAETSGEDW